MDKETTNAMDQDSESTRLPMPSKRYRIKMNRLFRERVGGSFLPFLEDDSLYERVRSKIVIRLKINELKDRLNAKKEKKTARKHDVSRADSDLI